MVTLLSSKPLAHLLKSAKMTEYVNPIDYEPGDVIYTDDSQAHIVEDVVGNMITTTDGLVEIIPSKQDEIKYKKDNEI